MQSSFVSRDYELFLEDIVGACRRIVRYVAPLTYDTFLADEQAADAVLYNLAVIGEAVKHVSDEIRARHPQVEWRKIAGLRDIVIHHYFGVDYDIVWDVAQNQIPELLDEVGAILASEGAD